MGIKFEIKENGNTISCMTDGSYVVTSSLGQILWSSHNLQEARVAARTEGGAK